MLNCGFLFCEACKAVSFSFCGIQVNTSTCDSFLFCDFCTVLKTAIYFKGEMEYREKSGIRHSNLLRAVSDFYRSRVITSLVRKETSTDISEYDIPPSTAKSLVYSLCRSFNSNGWKLHSHLNKTGKLAAFEDPVLAKNILRELSFRKLKGTLNRWNATIQHMRNTEQLIFPLNQGTVLTNKIENTSAFKTEVCKHLETQETDSFYSKGSQLKEEHKFNMTDAIKLHNERAKFNARYSYMLAKAARQRKIKSKKYHRMLKHKECLENVKNLDPLKADLILESNEKKRAKERATLRHRSTGHLAQHVRTRVKQNSERRKQLMKQMFYNSELNQKPNVTYSSEEESEEDEKNDIEAVVNNPWIKNPVILEGDTGILSEKLEGRLPSRVQFEMHLEENTRRNDIPSNLLDESSKNKQLVHVLNTPPQKINEVLNPDSFIKTKSRLFQLEDSYIQESCNNNAENAQVCINTIGEAFENDDITAEFRKEKEHVSKTSQLEKADTSVPGWGKWNGKDLRIKARKPSQSAVTRSKITFSKHENKKDIILMEDRTDKLKEQQVNEIPFSFTQVKGYEASIRFPIGNTWSPHTAHKKLVSPAVITKLGTVIKPIQ